jgi:O-antigen/teichoic acid export membrane protein
MLKKILKYLFNNLSEEQRIVKNSFWIALARFGGSLLRAILIIYSFRILGPSLQGSFSLAMNFILIFSFIPDFGLTAVLIREIIKNQSQRREILANAFLAVFFLLFLSILIINLTKFIFIKDELAQTLIFILSLFLIFDVLREFLYSLFRAEEKMELQALSHLTTNFLLLLFGVWLLKIKPHPFSLSQAYLLASFLGFLLTFLLLRKEIIFNYFKFFNSKLVFDLLNKSWSIGIANFLFLIITYLDSLIVGWFHPPKDVGLYTSVVKLIEFLYFFPAALAMAVFPILSKHADYADFMRTKQNNGHADHADSMRTNTDKRNLPGFSQNTLPGYKPDISGKNPGNNTKSLRKSASNDFQKTILFGFQLSFFISLPILGGLLILSKEIIDFIFGEKYLPVSLGFQFISFSIPLNFLLLILIDALIALEKRKELLIYDLVVVILNFLLNLFFVPQYSYFASSLITSISSFISLIFALFILKEYVPLSLKELKIFNYILTTILMMFLVYFLPFHLIVKIILGGLFYFFFLFLLKDPFLLKLTKHSF